MLVDAHHLPSEGIGYYVPLSIALALQSKLATRKDVGK